MTPIVRGKTTEGTPLPHWTLNSDNQPYMHTGRLHCMSGLFMPSPHSGRHLSLWRASELLCFDSYVGSPPGRTSQCVTMAPQAAASAVQLLVQEA